jgi:hypothetical protein
MAVLLWIQGKEGPISMCNENCYDSTVPECHCVCGGRNHGVGYKEAWARVGRDGFSMVRQYIEREKLNYPDLQIEILNVEIPWQAFTGS